MKKEKKVRTYQRRTKSGKMITVRAHTASYEAAEKAKEAAKKKGAGEELSSKVKKGEEWKLPMDEFLKKLKEERAQKREDEKPKNVEDEKPKKKSEKKTEKKTPVKKTTKKRTVGTGTNGPEPKKKTTTKKTATKSDTSEPAFTRDEFKEWYRGTGSAADKKVAKALRKQLGRSGYRKFEDEAIDNYTSRGHLSMFKRVSGGSSASANTKSSVKGKGSKPTLSKNMSENRSNASAQMKVYKKQLMSAIKEGNSKKIREARKGYMQAMDDSTFGGSKASKASAEKDYQSIVKALSKAGYDEQGYKKRSVGTGTNGPEPKKAKTKSSSSKTPWDGIQKGGLLERSDASKMTKNLYHYYDRKGRQFKATSDGLEFTGKIDTSKAWDGTKTTAASVPDRITGKGTSRTKALKEAVRSPKSKTEKQLDTFNKMMKSGAFNSKRYSDEGSTRKNVAKEVSLGLMSREKAYAITGLKKYAPKKSSVVMEKGPISEQSLNSKGFKTFKMPQIGTLYLGKKGKGAYIKFKGKKTIQKADIDDYGDFITGHNGLTKSQKKQLSSLGYTEHEEY